MSPAEHEACFDRWIREHGAILHRVSRAFAEGAGQADLMQELLLALWRAVPAFRGEASPATFVYRVSHNAAMTWRRAERNYRRYVTAYGNDATTAPAEASAPDQERLERLYAAIRRLPELDRSLILLALDGVSYREMAAVHGLTESNVGARLTRARARLADDLQGEHP
ncbi:MAG TPA: sigma-70 family RNA polymerase sigma factor [Opitutaceae bacterium]|nr:sigma-70 family RNA polymerase sigma factor [Opitutaceae bacterium]